MSDVPKKQACSILCQESELQCQLKCGGNMPCDQGHGSGDPANGRISERATDALRLRPAEKPANGTSKHPSGQPPKERQRWRTQQNQRRSDGHEQQMLHHVNGE